MTITQAWGGEGNRGNEEVMENFGVLDRSAEEQTVVDFAKRIETSVETTFSRKERNTGKGTEVDDIFCRRCNMQEIRVRKQDHER